MMPTQERVKDLLEYRDGMLYRRDGKPIRWNRLGRLRQYRAMHFDGEQHYLHRLVWIYHHGYTPVQVDHIDRDTANNHVENLRECTPRQNRYNCKTASHSKSGFKGVRRIPGLRSNPYQAKITLDGKPVFIGHFQTAEEAHEAYLALASLAFGEFVSSGVST